MRWSFEATDAGRAYGVRRDMLAFLRSRAGEESDFDAAALIYGELVGNVVRHAPGPIAVDVVWDGGTAVLRVVDQGPGFEWSGKAALPSMYAESGRGLFIASSVAESLQVCRLHGNGTQAVARLPVYLKDEFKSRI